MIFYKCQILSDGNGLFMHLNQANVLRLTGADHLADALGPADGPIPVGRGLLMPRAPTEHINLPNFVKDFVLHKIRPKTLT